MPASYRLLQPAPDDGRPRSGRVSGERFAMPPPQEDAMKQLDLTLPRLIAIAVTRALAGAGLGLLLADRIPHARRRPLGAVLLGIGAVSTLPLLLPVARKLRMTNGHIRTRAPSTVRGEGL